MAVYYNERDHVAAAWLRNLIEAGLIAPGDVDERDIRDVRPVDLKGYTQCHFFAGLGGWSYALRLAGWPDDRPVWTASPPCQPFSQAGKGLGKRDERHLAPVWLDLVSALRPPVVFGEQVAAAVTKDAWLDDLLDALEGAGYTTGAAVVPACSVGAPHIRQRLWFVGVGNPSESRSQGRAGMPECGNQFATRSAGVAGWVADADGRKCEGRTTPACRDDGNGQGTRRSKGDGCSAERGYPCRVADSTGDRRHRRERAAGSAGGNGAKASGEVGWSGPLDTFWTDADWLVCRDGLWRPVEPGTFPLADGVPARVGRLRAYGNAIVPQVAAEVIRAMMKKIDGTP